jgi:hypothetical protein
MRLDAIEYYILISVLIRSIDYQKAPSRESGEQREAIVHPPVRHPLPYPQRHIQRDNGR